MPFGSAFTVHNLGIDIAHLPTIYLVSGLFSIFTGPLVGRASDAFGKFPTFVFGSVVSIVMVLVYTHLGHFGHVLITVIAVNVLMFVGIFSRMIPSQALISAIPEASQRGSFSAVSASLQQLSGGLGSVLAAVIIAQNADGTLQHFDWLGYIVVATSLVSLSLMYFVQKSVAKRSGQTNCLKGCTGAAAGARGRHPAVKTPAHADSSERTHQGAERDDGGKRHEGADDADHHDIAIAVSVRRSADRKQSDHRAIVRQAIECARTDHRDAMEQRGIEPDLRRARHVCRPERVERNGQPTRRRAGEGCQHVGGDCQRYQRAAADAEHGVAHHGESRHRRHHGAEADQARHAHRRQYRGIGAGIHGGAQGRQPAKIDRDHGRRSRRQAR